MILSPWFCLLLAICLPSVCGLSHFPHKMQVMEKYQSVKLTCRTDADVRGPVTWKHKVEGLDQDRPVMKSRFANPSGLSLSLTDLDTPNAGEYSCWAEGRKLDHTYLFLKEDEDSQPTGSLVIRTEDLLIRSRRKKDSVSYPCTVQGSNHRPRSPSKILGDLRRGLSLSVLDGPVHSIHWHPLGPVWVRRSYPG
ncbi:hypothetical protein JZ751_006565 [Albula glossodonta]|uniref:Ig-like domain-containing protein n=1 Tax=Albula glossodonta TaxID=121402 RepID=A0A8T2NAB4_9TELE|nr:hypothetical protein JZ751_006565 [Albula glossodonta]